MPLGPAFVEPVLDSILGALHHSAFPAVLYVAALTAMPTTTPSTAIEATFTGSYARVAMNNDSTDWPLAATKLKRNGIAITFPAATAGWGTIVGYAFMTHATNPIDNTNTFYIAPLAVAKLVASGASLNFPALSLSISTAYVS